MELGESMREAVVALRDNRLRSALTMLGVIVGVGAVILLVSLGEGATLFVRRELTGIGTNLLIVQPGKQETMGGVPAPATTRKLTLDDTHALRRQVRFLHAVVPVTLGSALVAREGFRRNVMVIGTESAWTEVFNVRAEVGRFIDDGDDASARRVVVLGSTVAVELFGAADPLGANVDVGGSRFRVVGVAERKGQSLGFSFDDLVYIPMRVAMRIFAIDSLFGIRAKAVSNELLLEAADEIRRVLKERHGAEDFTVVTQDELMKTLDRIVSVLTTLLASIAAISLVVGGIGIMNIMLVTVKERTREIGLRKAVGARPRDVLIQFLVESATLSLMGGAVGTLLGIGGPFLLSLFVPQLPALIAPWGIALSLFFSIAVGILFGVYPAVQAARLRPIDALRHE